jgi:hypothetical protein
MQAAGECVICFDACAEFVELCVTHTKHASLPTLAHAHSRLRLRSPLPSDAPERSATMDGLALATNLSCVRFHSAPSHQSLMVFAGLSTHLGVLSVFKTHFTVCLDFAHTCARNPRSSIRLSNLRHHILRGSWSVTCSWIACNEGVCEQCEAGKYRTNRTRYCNALPGKGGPCFFLPSFHFHLPFSFPLSLSFAPPSSYSREEA